MELETLYSISVLSQAEYLNYIIYIIIQKMILSAFVEVWYKNDPFEQSFSDFCRTEVKDSIYAIVIQHPSC